MDSSDIPPVRRDPFDARASNNRRELAIVFARRPCGLGNVTLQQELG
jgi:hypothetical protein